MPRLNIKPTKAAFVKVLREAVKRRAALGDNPLRTFQDGKIQAATELAEELGIKIKPEEYQG